MSLLPIYNCYHPNLKKKTEPIAEINGTIKKLVDDMFDTMYKADGLGLAGNQIGENKSIFIVDASQVEEGKGKYAPMVIINPEIITFSDETIEYREGCLSIPTFYEHVVRPKHIQIRYYDLNQKEITIEADDILSRVMQHEFDHLKGVLFFERLTPVRRTLAKSKLRKIQKGQILADYDMIGADGKFYKKENSK
jgi:peptide deformylase